MSRFRPYTSLGGQRATFNTCQARPVPMQALPPRLQHHRNFRIGITSLLTVSALLSIGVPSESAALAQVVSGIGVKGTGRFVS